MPWLERLEVPWEKRRPHASSPADRSPPAWPPGEARSPPWSRWAGSATRPSDSDMVSASVTSVSEGGVEDTLHVEREAGQQRTAGNGRRVLQPLHRGVGAIDV